MQLNEQLIVSIIDNIEQGIIILDEQHNVVYLNNYAGELFNVEQSQPLSEDLFNSLMPETNQKVIRFKNKTIEINWDKQFINSANILVGYFKDITYHTERDYKLSCLEQIIDSIHEGVVAHDMDGRIFIFNKASEKLEGISKDQVLGKNIFDVYELNAQSSQHHIVMEIKKPQLEIYEKFFTKEGKEINLVSDNFPFYCSNEIAGVYAICRNITKVQELLNQTIKLQHQINNTSNIKNSPTRYSFKDIIGSSHSLRKAILDAHRASENDSSVLVVGDTGTGKELFVQSIHSGSSRSSKPFVAINCAAIPGTLLEGLLFGSVKGSFTGATDSSGLFEQAGEGTLFLDELNSMDLNLQAKLLRVLQEKVFRRLGGNKEIPIKCRIISATNQEPLDCITNGKLRQDLFYRLAVITIYIPPLRERKEDIEPLIKHFISLYNQKYNANVKSISTDLMDMFMKYNWPGNIRELQNLIESAVVMVEGEQTIRLEHMPYYFFNLFSQNKSLDTVKLLNISSNLTEILLETEKKLILQALLNYEGNITQAANSLGIPRQNLNYKIKKFNIDINKMR